MPRGAPGASSRRARPCVEIARVGASRAGVLRLTVTQSEAGLDVDVGGGKPLDATLRTALAALAETHDLARARVGGRTRGDAAAARAALRPRARDAAARRLPASHPEGAAALLDGVRAAVGPAARVADLFAGCGTFALPLAETAEVHAVEGQGAMLAALDAGWRAAGGLKRVSVEPRDLFRRPLAGAELARFDAVVVDPPRAGAEAQMRALAAARVARIAAVSCNPVSFARDAAILVAGGYLLEEVRVIDQFRWSGHVELVARLTRAV